jgi:hypothetical protein
MTRINDDLCALFHQPRESVVVPRTNPAGRFEPALVEAERQ